jgi:hypothetical protein
VVSAQQQGGGLVPRRGCRKRDPVHGQRAVERIDEIDRAECRADAKRSFSMERMTNNDALLDARILAAGCADKALTGT